jgi:hypothetical protein
MPRIPALCAGLAFATAIVFLAALATILGTGLVDGAMGIAPGAPRASVMAANPVAWAFALTAVSLAGALAAVRFGSDGSIRGR